MSKTHIYLVHGRKHRMPPCTTSNFEMLLIRYREAVHMIKSSPLVSLSVILRCIMIVSAMAAGTTHSWETVDCRIGWSVHKTGGMTNCAACHCSQRIPSSQTTLSLTNKTSFTMTHGLRSVSFGLRRIVNSTLTGRSSPVSSFPALLPMNLSLTRDVLTEVCHHAYYSKAKGITSLPDPR